MLLQTQKFPCDAEMKKKVNVTVTQFLEALALTSSKQRKPSISLQFLFFSR